MVVIHAPSSGGDWIRLVRELRCDDHRVIRNQHAAQDSTSRQRRLRNSAT